MTNLNIFQLALLLAALGWCLLTPAALVVRVLINRTPAGGRRDRIGKAASAMVNFNRAVFKGLVLLLLLVVLSNLASKRPVTIEKEEEVVISSDRFERDDNLQSDADALLPLFDGMASVPVYLRDEPILKSGTNTERGVAYTQCEDHRFPSIFVKKAFYQKTNRKQLTNILKHELTHAWQCRQQVMWGHDAGFRQKFKEVGGFGN